MLLTDALAQEPGHAEALALRAEARVATAQYEAAASDASAALAKVRAVSGVLHGVLHVVWVMQGVSMMDVSGSAIDWPRRGSQDEGARGGAVSGVRGAF